MMDNRIFNVNGKSKEDLLQTIILALATSGSKDIKGWSVNPKKGLVLFSYGEKENKFPVPVAPSSIIDMVWDWLKTDEAKKIPHENAWDSDHQHDGDNGIGWRVFVEDWGHVDGKWGVVACIKPAFMWYGK